MGTILQRPETYDHVYSTGGHDAIYHLPYWRSQYFPLYKKLVEELKRYESTDLLEVGCGNGAFAHLCQDKLRIRYRGFDFSPKAIEMARQLCGQSELFSVADATVADNYVGGYDAIVCSEVLEHIPNDIEVISCWPKGVACICSVPNFDSKYHERFFKSREEVLDRYGSLIDIERVSEVFIPLLSDLGVSNKLKSAARQLFHPIRLVALLGRPQLLSSRRWFVFAGRKN